MPLEPEGARANHQDQKLTNINKAPQYRSVSPSTATELSGNSIAIWGANLPDQDCDQQLSSWLRAGAVATMSSHQHRSRGVWSRQDDVEGMRRQPARARPGGSGQCGSPRRSSRSLLKKLMTAALLLAAAPVLIDHPAVATFVAARTPARVRTLTPTAPVHRTADRSRTPIRNAYSAINPGSRQSTPAGGCCLRDGSAGSEPGAR